MILFRKRFNFYVKIRRQPVRDEYRRFLNRAVLPFTRKQKYAKNGIPLSSRDEVRRQTYSRFLYGTLELLL